MPLSRGSSGAGRSAACPQNWRLGRPAGVYSLLSPREVRALHLLADHGGASVTGRALAARYGFSSHSKVPPALERLRGRGLVDRRDGSGPWYIVDPLFDEWLRRFSPLADRRQIGPPTEE
ncbi:MAG: hypothetical protein QOG11_1240 [Solirubrobacteraceae bacterium]|nr:hypothetical protein [Solirubrobacteraceae bacterium]